MSPVLNQPDSINTSLRLLYAPIADELQQTEQILRDEMRSEFPFVDELVRYGVLLGGKRLRPALLLLTGKALGNVTREHFVLGAVVEMIHTATLVHDDVLDEAETRRHLATVNCRWDNKASVLLGDYLFTHAFYLASTLSSTRACRLIGMATNTVCAGELRQKGTIGDFNLTEDEYFDIISAKTAELCACSCELGAHYAEAPSDVVTNMASFGRDLGIAFQIADDVLDVAGDEQTTGKSLGTDIEQQKPTLPIIRILQLASSSERKQLLAILQNDSIDRLAALRPFFDRFDAINYSKNQACAFAERATQQLLLLPPSASRDMLATMAEFVVARSR